MNILRMFREQQYETLIDAVYKERSWTNGGCPTIELIEDLGIAYDKEFK